ncbi:hypothetical protein Q1695_014663 [Nippostrongylus brasiliensis]|nr:hypothetical protein Q1695_014663 [Nippostrongylus brasiliensis]
MKEAVLLVAFFVTICQGADTLQCRNGQCPIGYKCEEDVCVARTDCKKVEVPLFAPSCVVRIAADYNHCHNVFVECHEQAIDWSDGKVQHKISEPVKI